MKPPSWRSSSTTRRRGSTRVTGNTIDCLPPSVRHEAAYVRAQLLLAVSRRRRAMRARRRRSRGGEAAADVELDEAEYPPAVRSYKAARAAARGAAPPQHRAHERARRRRGRSQRAAGGTDAGETGAPAGRCFRRHARRVQAAPRRLPIRARHGEGLEPAGKDGLRDQLRGTRIATDRPGSWSHCCSTRWPPRTARAGFRGARSRSGPRAQGAGVLRGRARAETRRAVAPARHRAGQAVRGRARAGAAHAAHRGTGGRHAVGRARAGGARRHPGLGTAVAFVRRKGSGDFLPPGSARGGAVSGRCRRCWRATADGTSSTTSRGATAAARSRVGPETPRRRCISGASARRPSPGPTPRPGAGTCGPLAVVAAGAAATGVYFITCSDDVSVRGWCHEDWGVRAVGAARRLQGAADPI